MNNVAFKVTCVKRMPRGLCLLGWDMNKGVELVDPKGTKTHCFKDF